jgi:hypothetical protein
MLINELRDWGDLLKIENQYFLAFVVSSLMLQLQQTPIVKGLQLFL